MGPLFEQLVGYFTRFPGIGPRQARRFVYFMLKQDPAWVENFIANIEALRAEVRQCPDCGRFYSGGRALKCKICADPNRDSATLLLVEKDADLDAIEHTSTYQGRYFVIGGLIPILDQAPEEKIRLKQLLAYLNDHDKIREVIIALAAHSEGDHTADYLKSVISKTSDQPGQTGKIKISMLGRGLSTGSELEYADANTLRNALNNRG